MSNLRIDENTLSKFIAECRNFLQSNLDNPMVDNFTSVLYNSLKMYVGWGFHWIGNYEDEDDLEDSIPYFARFIIIPHISEIVNVDWEKFGVLDANKPNTIIDNYENQSNSMGENSPLNAEIDSITSPNIKAKSVNGGKNTKTFSGDLVNLEWVKKSIADIPVIYEIIKDFRKLIVEYMQVF